MKNSHAWSAEPLEQETRLLITSVAMAWAPRWNKKQVKWNGQLINEDYHNLLLQEYKITVTVKHGRLFNGDGQRAPWLGLAHLRDSSLSKGQLIGWVPGRGVQLCKSHERGELHSQILYSLS